MKIVLLLTETFHKEKSYFPIMATQTMHAIQVHNYGDADQLRFEQISLPEPQEGEVLVRVHAAGVNPIDWKIRAGFLKDFMPATFPYVPGLH